MVSTGWATCATDTASPPMVGRVLQHRTRGGAADIAIRGWECEELERRSVRCLTKGDLARPAGLLRNPRRRGGHDPARLRSGRPARTPAQPHQCHSRALSSRQVDCNRLLPDSDRALSQVSAAGKCRHTSSSSIALELPGDGWMIDTPGVRSFSRPMSARRTCWWPSPTWSPAPSTAHAAVTTVGPRSKRALVDWAARDHVRLERLRLSPGSSIRTPTRCTPSVSARRGGMPSTYRPSHDRGRAAVLAVL